MIKITYLFSVCVIAAVILIYFNFYGHSNFSKSKSTPEKPTLPKNIIAIIDQKLNAILQKLPFFDNVGEWFRYIQENDVFTVNGEKLYLFCYEAIDKEKTKFQIKAHYDTDYLNMMWEDLFVTQEDNFVFSREEADKDLIPNMYSASQKEKVIIRYYWTDPVKLELTLKQALVSRWEKNGRSGILGMGYTIENLGENVPQKINEKTRQINQEMTVRLFWLNVVFAILFVFLAYFTLIEDSYILPRKKFFSLVGCVIFTWFFLGYQYYIKKRTIMDIDNQRKELNDLQNMMKTDKTIVATFPLLLLALGILLRRHELQYSSSQYGISKSSYNLVTNLFLWATFFGLILPFLIDTLVIDYDDLQRLLLLDSLRFICICYGFGIIVLLLMVVYTGKNNN